MFDTLQTHAVSTQNNLANFRVCTGLFWVHNISKLVCLFQTTIKVLLKIEEKQIKWLICYTVKFVYLIRYIPIIFCPLPVQTAQLLQRYCPYFQLTVLYLTEGAPPQTKLNMVTQWCLTQFSWHRILEFLPGISLHWSWNNKGLIYFH